jgi:hypothetical protein
MSGETWASGRLSIVQHADGYALLRSGETLAEQLSAEDLADLGHVSLGALSQRRKQRGDRDGLGGFMEDLDELLGGKGRG